MTDQNPYSEDQDVVKPFMEHLEDLRTVLIRVILVIVISCALCGYFAPYVLKFLTYPLAWSGIQDPNGKQFLTVLDPGVPFSLPFTLAFYAGIVVASPFIFYFIGSYILPALTIKEKGYVLPVFLMGALFFLAGVASCYFFLLPTTLKVSKDFATWMNLEMNAWTIDSYISFVTTFMLGMGIAFEFPLLLLFLAKIGIVSYEFLASSRRYAIVVILLISAIVTPSSDAFTMCIMALPLVVMYEACIWAAWFMQRKKA
jgi:sec-independent protein translocase protein TatC